MKVISTVSFMDDGSVVIVYIDPHDDVRNRGLVAISRQVHISRGTVQDYAEEIDDLNDAAIRLLNDALEDWTATPPDAGTPTDVSGK